MLMYRFSSKTEIVTATYRFLQNTLNVPVQMHKIKCKNISETYNYLEMNIVNTIHNYYRKNQRIVAL